MSQGAILSVQARRGGAAALAAERSRELTRRAIPDPRAASRSRLKLGSFPGVIGGASSAQANSARAATMAIASQSRKTPPAVRARAIGAPLRRPHARRWPDVTPAAGPPASGCGALTDQTFLTRLCYDRAMSSSSQDLAAFPAFAAAGVRDLQAFSDATAALERITRIYDKGVQILRAAFARFTRGEDLGGPVDAFYPFLGIDVTREALNLDARLSFGALHDPGVYGTTLTRPALFADYYRRQIELLLRHHGVPVVVGISDRRMPLPFVIEESTADISHERVPALQAAFPT
jgi:hypothetical protein